MYQHSSEILQTSYPTPRLENAGRSPKTEHLVVAGTVDQPNNSVTLRIDGLTDDQSVIEMKVENGVSYGRYQGAQDWTELGETADIFVSEGNPLGFLAAIENVQLVPDSVDPLAVGEAGLNDWIENPQALYPEAYTHYTFEINGHRYAEYISAQLEAEMQRTGELPSGIQ